MQHDVYKLGLPVAIVSAAAQVRTPVLLIDT